MGLPCGGNCEANFEILFMGGEKKCANANMTSIFEYIDASGTHMRKCSDVFI